MKSRAILISILFLILAILAGQGLEPRQHTCLHHTGRPADPADGPALNRAKNPAGIADGDCQACIFAAHSRAVSAPAVPAVAAPDPAASSTCTDRDEPVLQARTIPAPRGPPPVS